MTTLLRRKLALTAGLVVLAVPVLSSCGFEYATDQPNVIADGGFNNDGQNVRINASRIVASQDNQGTFIATITLNPTVNAVTSPKNTAQKYALTGLETAPGTTAGQSGSIDPVTGINKTVNAHGVANLSSPEVGGIPVTGSFTAGDVIPVTLSFADGEKLTVQTPVVRDCGYNQGAGQTGSPSPSPTATGAGQPGKYDCFYAPLPSPSE